MGVYLEDLTYKEILPILARTGKLIDTRKIIEIDLVRCEKCEHWNDEDHWCNIRDSYGWDYKPTDYCSYGERRADEFNIEGD